MQACLGNFTAVRGLERRESKELTHGYIPLQVYDSNCCCFPKLPVLDHVVGTYIPHLFTIRNVLLLRYVVKILRVSVFFLLIRKTWYVPNST